MTTLLTYEGYTLTDRASGGYRSVIDGKPVTFDSAAQWVEYINILKGKDNGKRN